MSLLKTLSIEKQNELALAFKGGISDALITGPCSLYRFAGYREDGGENNPHGAWWFSKEVYNDFHQKSKRLNVSFSDFAKARLALPDAWNDKLHIYELNLSAGTSLNGLKGIAAAQRLNGKNKMEKEDRNNMDHIFLMGGHEQYFFDYNEIKKYPVQQVFKF